MSCFQLKFRDFDSAKNFARSLKLKNKRKVTGTYDLIVDGAVDDIKSASDWDVLNSVLRDIYVN